MGRAVRPLKVLEDSFPAPSQLLVLLAVLGVPRLSYITLISVSISTRPFWCVCVCSLLVRIPATALEVTLIHCDVTLIYLQRPSFQIRLRSEVPVHMDFGETRFNTIQLGGPCCLHSTRSATCHVQGHFKPQRMDSARDSSLGAHGLLGEEMTLQLCHKLAVWPQLTLSVLPRPVLVVGSILVSPFYRWSQRAQRGVLPNSHSC